MPIKRRHSGFRGTELLSALSMPGAEISNLGCNKSPKHDVLTSVGKMFQTVQFLERLQEQAHAGAGEGRGTLPGHGHSRAWPQRVAASLQLARGRQSGTEQLTLVQK